MEVSSESKLTTQALSLAASTEKDEDTVKQELTVVGSEKRIGDASESETKSYDNTIATSSDSITMTFNAQIKKQNGDFAGNDTKVIGNVVPTDTEQAKMIVEVQVKKQNATYKRLAFRNKRWKQMAEISKQKAEQARWRGRCDLSVGLGNKEQGLKKELGPLQDEIKALKSIPPFLESTEKRCADGMVLQDEFEEFKNVALTTLHKANQKLSSSLVLLENKSRDICRQLEQRWRLFGRSKLRQDLVEVENLKEAIKKNCQKVLSEIVYLETQFQLSRR